jgi:hypothetical protein
MPLNDRQTDFKGYLKDQLFNRVRPLTFDELETKASGFASLLFEDLTAIEIGEVLQELTQENAVEMALGDSIVDPTTFRPWIAQRREEVETRRWDAYKKVARQPGLGSERHQNARLADRRCSRVARRSDAGRRDMAPTWPSHG